MRRLYAVMFVTVVPIMLVALSVIVSRGDADRCLSVFKYEQILENYLLDTLYGRFQRLSPMSQSIRAANSPDARFFASFEQQPGGVMQIVLHGSPTETHPQRRTVIRAGMLAERSPMTALDHLMWSPDSRAFAYLWRDSGAADEAIYLSVYDVSAGTEHTVPYAQLSGSRFTFYGIALDGWSGDGRVISVREQTADGVYFRFFAADSLALLVSPLDDVRLFLSAWSPVEARLVAVDFGAGGRVRLYLSDLNTASPPIPLDIPRRALQDIVWSGDGRYFAIVSHLTTCIESVCDVHWRYDLYRADGTPVALELSSLHEISFDSPSQLLMGVWQGDQWIWAEQTASAAPINLVALDLITGERVTLAENIVRSYVADMFYVGASGFIPLPTGGFALRVPAQARLVVPVRQNGRIHVDLFDLAAGTTTRLVSDAHTLSRPGETLGTAFWRADGQTVQVLWSHGDAPNRETHLTVMHLDENILRSTADGTYHILAPAWIDDRRMGFINQVGSDYTFNLFDTRTGEQRRLLDLQPGATRWTGVVNPSGDALAVRVGGVATRSQILIAPLDGSRQTEISQTLSSEPSWSPDGSRIAFAEFLSASAAFTVVTTDGQRISRTPLDTTPLTPTVWITGWSRCDPNGT